MAEGDARAWRHKLLGGSAAMERVRQRIERLSGVDAPVLVRGATGTGKELVARALHDAGPRHLLPFVGVNVAAIPEALFESVLFGHVAGAFTGAKTDQKGQLERAADGTLFLDEIGDLSPAVQVKLLRVLEERTFLPVGALEERRLRARILAATHADLDRAVDDGRFRDDLFYRLSAFELWIPTLSERPEDIPELVRHFAAASGCRVDDEALDALTRVRWAGNVRQLRAAVERLSLFSQGVVTRRHVEEDPRLGGLCGAPPPKVGQQSRTISFCSA